MPAPTKETPTPLREVSEISEIRNYSATMRFSTVSDGEEYEEVNLALSNDVYFVTVSPCVSSSHMDLLKFPTSSTFQASEQPVSSNPIGTSKPVLSLVTRRD